MNGSALQGSRLCAESVRVQLLGFGLFWIDQSLDPLRFIRGNNRSTPNGGTHSAAELPLDVRDHPPSHAITNRPETFVCRIFAKFDSVPFYKCVDLFGPYTEERTNNLEFNPKDPPRNNLPHSDESSRTSAAKHVHQKGLNEIIRVMSQENCVASPPPRDARKKFVARRSPHRFD